MGKLFLLLITAYYFVAWGFSVWIYHQPRPEALTLIKYSISRYADWIEWDYFFFDLPEEWKAEILQAVPDFPMEYPVRHFHLLLDYLEKPIFYKAFPYYFLIVLVFCLLLKVFKSAKSDERPEAKRGDKYSRGTRLVTSEAFCKIVKNAVSDPAATVRVMPDKEDNFLRKLLYVVLPFLKPNPYLFFSGSRLREHLAIFGASGTGKSQFLLAFLASFFANKSSETRVIIVDRKGEFFAHFGRKEDIIFNPFDERSVRWSLFNELDIPEEMEKVPPDIWAIAQILFPPPKTGDPFWQDSAAKVFCSAVVSCIKAGKLKNQELVNFCNQDWSEIVKVIKDLTPGLDVGKVVAANPTTGGSILAAAQNGVQMFSVCPDGDFSIRKWIKEGSGNLFLSAAGKNDKVFIPILSLFVDLIGREIQELDNENEGGVKYLFLIDELAAYPAMTTLHFLVAEARSKGVAVVIATQTIQKMLKTYGNQDGKDIIGNCKTKVIFKTGEEEDATYLSKTIGQTEVQRVQVSENENASTVFGRIDGRMGETKTKQIVTEPVFLPSELMTLGTGNAIVLHPCAGENVSKLKFAPFAGEKRGIEFAPIQEKTISAREYAEMERKRKDEEEARKKEETEEKMKILQKWEKKQEAADEQEAVKDNYLL